MITMERITRSYCIDTTLVTKLKDLNASDLINQLLTNHFEIQNMFNWELEAVEQIADLLHIKENTEKQIKQIEDTQKTKCRKKILMKSLE